MTAAKAKPDANGLDLLRKPFPATQVSQLPRVTCKGCSQSHGGTCDKHEKRKCQTCSGWVSTAHIHLDFVGHAALTDRLLDADPNWSWEPLAYDDRGLPAYDAINGLWIKLTICGITRLGYGDAQGKSGNNAVKEIIGDALRNAAMRFGAALDLWHKGDLHADDHTEAAVEHRQLVDKTLADENKAARGIPADDPWAKPIETDPVWLTDWTERLERADSQAVLRGLWDEVLMLGREGKISDADLPAITALKDAKKDALAEPAA
jgi:hypothetical protein